MTTVTGELVRVHYFQAGLSIISSKEAVFVGVGHPPTRQEWATVINPAIDASIDWTAGERVTIIEAVGQFHIVTQGASV